MVGPSSSHTAGAVIIANYAREFLGSKITWASIYLYESFAKTYKGHGTDLALVGGLLGMGTDDTRIKNAYQLAEDEGMKVEIIEDTTASNHPNTVRICIGNEKSKVELVGISIGGGKVEVTELNGFKLRLSGNHPAILVQHNDRADAINAVSKVFTKHRINIGHIEVNRQEGEKEALMIIEVDQNVKDSVLNQLNQSDYVQYVLKVVT